MVVCINVYASQSELVQESASVCTRVRVLMCKSIDDSSIITQLHSYGLCQPTGKQSAMHDSIMFCISWCFIVLEYISVTHLVP